MNELSGGLLAFSVIVFVAGLVVLLAMQFLAEHTDRPISTGTIWAGAGLIIVSIVPALLAGFVGATSALLGTAKPPAPTGLFATAITLASLGVLGLIAYAVSQRLDAQSAFSFVYTIQSTFWLGISITVAVGGAWLLLDTFSYLGALGSAPHIGVVHVP